MDFLKRCKDEMLKLQVDFITEMTVNRAKYKSSVAAGIGIGSTLFGVVPMLADGENIDSFFTKIGETIEKIYNGSILVVSVLAAVALVIAFIMRMTANPQKASQATSWIFRILVSYLAINCIGLLFKVINSATKDQNFAFKWSEFKNG